MLRPTLLSKTSATVTILGVTGNEGHMIPPHFFPQGLRVNSAAYIHVLETVAKPWIDNVRNGRPYALQRDSAPSHISQAMQEWMAENFHDHITPNIWPPNSPDLHPLDYYVCSVVERGVSEYPPITLKIL